MFYFLTLFGAKLGQPCIYNYCQGGASGCFRTKHQGTEGNRLPPGGGRAAPGSPIIEFLRAADKTFEEPKVVCAVRSTTSLPPTAPPLRW